MRPIALMRGLRIRHKMYMLIVLQLALLVVAYVYGSTVMETEMLRRLTEHNSQLNAHNLTQMRDALAEIKNACAATLNLENPAVSRETEQLFKQLRAYHDINLSFRNTNKLWVRYLRELPYLRRLQMSPSQGATVYMEKDSEVFFLTSTDPESAWFTEAMSRRGDYCFSARGDLFMVSRAIINPAKYEKLGVIAASVDLSMLSDHFEHNQLFPNQRYWLFTGGVRAMGDDSLSFEQAQEMVERPTPNDSILIDRRAGKVYLYQMTRSPTPLLSLTEIPYDAIFGQVLQSSLGAIWAVTLYVLGSFVIVLMIVRGMFRSLKLFELAFGQIERGEFGQTLTAPVEPEFGAFLGAFNRMSVRLKQLIDEVYEKNLTQHKLELQMLRSQINPHFFYNTLEALRMNSGMGRERENIRMIEHLSAILRYGLAAGSEPVLIRDEIAQLENYVRLHNLRSDAQIELRVFLPPELMARESIRLLFQPLVENAIQHGLNAEKLPLSICVSGYRDGDVIVFRVADDGGGLPPEQLDCINRQLRGESGDARLGIGLKNVNRRLQLFYGDDYGLTLQSRQGQGVEVIIRIPNREVDAPCA